MRSLSMDARMVLLVLTADAISAGAGELLELWIKSTRRGRVTELVRRFEALGWVGRPGSGPLDGRLPRITPLGSEVVWGAIDPPALWERPWDGTWRFVLFDVPQTETRLRTKLRRRLRELRFGWLQNSVWLSPDPLRDLDRELGLSRVAVESLVLIEGRPAGGESDAELAAGAWDFPKVAHLHAAYLKLARLLPAKARDSKLEAWKSWIAAEQRAWQQIVRHDPFLPRMLHPPGYAGPAVWQARQEALHTAARGIRQAIERA